MQLFKRKATSDLLNDAESPLTLKRSLGAGDLIMLSIGAVIGAGISRTIVNDSTVHKSAGLPAVKHSKQNEFLPGKPGARGLA